MGGAEARDGLDQSPEWDRPSGSTQRAGGQLEPEPAAEEQTSLGPGVAGLQPHPLALLPLAEGARNCSWCKGILLSVHAREFLFGNLHGRGLLYTHTYTP